MLARRAVVYLEGLDDRGVAPLPDAMANLATLNRPLPNGEAQPMRS
jgi:hypothetical protein